MIIFTEVHLPRQEQFTYPREEVERALQKYSEEQIVPGRAIGCFPPGDSACLELSAASHRVKSLKLLPDGMIYGEFETLKTPGGEQMIGAMVLGHKWVIACLGIPDEKGVISGLQINTVYMYLLP